MTAPLSVPDAIHHRRSVKRFKPDPIPPDLLNQLVDLTVAAPSSYNLQPWRIVLIDDPAQKEALADVSWRQKQIVDAPVTFVFAVSIGGWEHHFETILAQGGHHGAWPEKVAEYFRGAIPGFQKGLGPLAREYAVKDALIAATHTALAAESLGLGTCFMNGWSEEGVKKVIGVADDPDIAIALLLPVGYPADRPKFSGRLDQRHTVFRNRLA